MSQFLHRKHSHKSVKNALEIIKMKGRTTRWKRKFMTKRADYGTSCREITISLVSHCPKKNRTQLGHFWKKTFVVIKEYKRAFYTKLLTSCKLNSYLADIDMQAEEIFSRLVKQLAEKENITENLKVENQMLWVQMMNNIRSRAMGIVNSELIFTV